MGQRAVISPDPADSVQQQERHRDEGEQNLLTRKKTGILGMEPETPHTLPF